MKDMIPRFSLFGEDEKDADAAFLHVEQLERRSRPNDWTIRPHLHRDLHQILLIERGGGGMLVNGARVEFAAPALLLVRAGEVHGFAFVEDSVGHVLTMSDPLLRHGAHRLPELLDLFETPRAFPVGSELLGPIADAFRRIEAELEGEVHQGRAGAEALLAYLLILAVRVARRGDLAVQGKARRDVILVERFRRLIEVDLRIGTSMVGCAAMLGVSAARLRRACVEVAGNPPLVLLHQRLLAEAKRDLAYGPLRVSEIAYRLGFDDPAYFSRFFLRRAGCSPAAYRRSVATAEPSLPAEP